MAIFDSTVKFITQFFQFHGPNFLHHTIGDIINSVILHVQIDKSAFELPTITQELADLNEADLISCLLSSHSSVYKRYEQICDSLLNKLIQSVSMCPRFIVDCLRELYEAVKERFNLIKPSICDFSRIHVIWVCVYLFILLGSHTTR